MLAVSGSWRTTTRSTAKSRCGSPSCSPSTPDSKPGTKATRELHGLDPADDEAGALQALGRFCDLYATGELAEYHKIVDAIINWSDEILAWHHTNRASNGRIEGSNILHPSPTTHSPRFHQPHKLRSPRNPDNATPNRQRQPQTPLFRAGPQRDAGRPNTPTRAARRLKLWLPDNPVGGRIAGVSNDSQLVRACLQKWAEDLVDLSRRNRLLYFKHLKSGTLEFEQPAATVLAGLRRTGSSAGWGIFIPASPAPESDQLDLGSAAVKAPQINTELVVAEDMGKSGKQIAQSLKTLDSKTRTEFLDTGLHMLHLGLGFLHWRDVDEHGAKDTTLVRSPLYLLPVELQQDRAQGLWRLVESARSEAEINPTLAVAFEKHYGLELPTLEDLPSDDFASVAEAVRRVVRPQGPQGWKVDDSVVLATFTFHKDAMYRDLRDNEDTIAGHPTIRLLAEGPGSAQAAAVDFEMEPEDSLDERHPPEDLACVLDADATQRRCLIHARQGSSFVMDGPPGTGKSQTITNVIAQLLQDGKTVLFVSEKAAALEVVHNRLAEVRLDPFVLALHSHKTTRKAFHQELGKALRERPQATSSFTAADRADIERRRKQLTDYAVAVNEVRRPLQRSLHDVVGEVSQVAEYPCVPLPKMDCMKLDPTLYQRIVEHSEQIERAWAPVERGDDFLWRDLAKERLSVSEQAEYRHRVEQLRKDLSDLRRVCADVQQDLHIAVYGSITRSEWLQELLRLVEDRCPVSPSWLTTPSIEEANRQVEVLACEAERLSEATDELDRWSTQWRNLEAAAADRFDRLRAESGEFVPSGLLDGHDSDQLRGLQSGLESAVEAMRAADWHCGPLAEAFGVDGELSVDTIGKLASLGALSETEALPEAAWFHDGDLEAARAAQQALEGAVDLWLTRRGDLLEDFTVGVVELDLVGLRTRFTEQHKGAEKADPHLPSRQGDPCRSHDRRPCDQTNVGASR